MTAGRARHRRRIPLLLLALAVLLVAGYVAFRIATRESSAPASVGAAVARFRALPGGSRALPHAPPPGVYVYATRGSEVSHVLGTRRHPYPARTTITVTVTPAGCLRQRWDALATRHDALLACPRGAPPASDSKPVVSSWRLVNQSEEHQFAGHVDRRTYACTRTSTFLPARLTAGARWSSRCSIEGTTTADAGTVIGPRTLTLDGHRRRTLLLRTTTRVSGDTVGVGTTFTWVLPSTRLVLRRTIANASTTDTIVGGVRYDERATLALSSLRPRR
jgi:hypothetical protein